jgi:hypothetical protein
MLVLRIIGGLVKQLSTSVLTRIPKRGKAAILQSFVASKPGKIIDVTLL